VLKGWESFSGWYWFATEKVEDDFNGKPLWYGFVQGHEEEWGDFSEAELDELKGKIWEIPRKNLVWSGKRKLRDDVGV
jgi:hypothetical protein